MPNRYPAEQRERATRMALDRLDEYGSAWAVAQALGPKLGIGPETLRKWVIQAQTDTGQRSGPSLDFAPLPKAVLSADKAAVNGLS